MKMSLATSETPVTRSSLKTPKPYKTTLASLAERIVYRVLRVPYSNHYIYIYIYILCVCVVHQNPVRSIKALINIRATTPRCVEFLLDVCVPHDRLRVGLHRRS